MKKSIFLVCLVVFGVVSLSAIGPIVSVSRLGWQTDSISYGISRMVDIASLPLLDRGISVHYEGSIDKRGKNADWDWSLYQDQRGEWVIFDVDGPGCIYNLVQHRYMSSSDPLFRFYFDGEETPRFSLRLSEFGEKEPFIKPLAESYIGPFDNGRGPIRVARSFVPMPFNKGCRVTTDVKLEGYERTKGEGGWGHVVYHTYADNGIKTFTGKENYDTLIQLWKKQGSNLLCKDQLAYHRKSEQKINAGESITLLDEKGEGAIGSLKFYFPEINEQHLQNVWIHMFWDAHQQPDISCPLACLGGNSLGFHDTNYLLSGYNTDGWFYNYFPMPYWKHAKIIIENRSGVPVSLGFSEIAVSRSVYPTSNAGYFRNTPYYTRKHMAGIDSPIAAIQGRGKMVAAHVTCHAERSHIISCEGDVRVYIDGKRTPQVESDGSESYVCYGWGFPTPPEVHPMGGYDGLSDNPWSMTRFCIGDSYPFYSELKFGIESGEYNNQYLEHSGTIFYYGQDKNVLVKTDSLDLNSSRSIKRHSYKAMGNVRRTKLESFFEGNEDRILYVGETVRFESFSSFRVNISSQNEGVRLRRLSDQNDARQAARVFVDGEEVTERLWYVADSNPYKRWLEDDFEIPAKYTKGKKSLNIRIVPVSMSKEGKNTWNEAEYQVFCYNN